MSGTNRLLTAILVGISLLQAPLASAVIIGQIDTFEDGTTENWTVGMPATHPAPPVNVPAGGPAGAEDNYLLVQAFGDSGEGSRLSIINFDQWSGDYLAAGVNAIAMDLNNSGPDDLFLRLLFADPIPGPPNNVAFSTDPIFVPAGSGWVSVLFPISLTDLTAGLGAVSGALSGATEMRLFHNPVADFPGPGIGPAPVVASLGIDNIRAATPEPMGAGALLFGLAALLAARKSG